MESPIYLMIRLKPFILNNRKKPNLLTTVILIIFAIVNIYLSFLQAVPNPTFNISFHFRWFFLFGLLIFAFLVAPRSVLLNGKGMRYNLGWREPWENIASFSCTGNNIEIMTKNGKKRRIRDINENDIPYIRKFIDEQMRIANGL